MWQSILPTVAWPIFFLVIFVVFYLEIRSLLRALINLCNRADSFEFAGFRLGSGSPISLGEQNISDVRYIEMLKAFQSPIVTNEENIIRKQLFDAKCSAKQANDILISQLAHRILLTQLFYIDRFIFNEQISLLLYLNSEGRSCLVAELHSFYVKYQNNFRQQALSNVPESAEDQFFAFLNINGLINLSMAGFSITSLGKDYLAFAVRVGRPLPQLNLVDRSQNNNRD